MNIGESTAWTKMMASGFVLADDLQRASRPPPATTSSCRSKPMTHSGMGWDQHRSRGTLQLRRYALEHAHAYVFVTYASEGGLICCAFLCVAPLHPSARMHQNNVRLPTKLIKSRIALTYVRQAYTFMVPHCARRNNLLPHHLQQLLPRVYDVRQNEPIHQCVHRRFLINHVHV
jgi:hypothetical protein